MKRVLLAMMFGSFVATLGAQTTNLETVFRQPPVKAKPLVWWHWINGNVTREGIRADLEDMKRVGIGGAQILDVEIYLPPGPVRYGTDAWHEHVQYAIKTAHELGLEITMANSPGWSGSGGPWITPDRAMKQLVFSETDTDGGNVSLPLPKPPAKLNFYRDVAVFAVPVTTARIDKLPAKVGFAARPVTREADDASAPGIAPEQIINLTSKMDAAGKLTASLPPGRWTLLRMGFTATGAQNHPAQPEGHGLECDKIDPATIAFEFDKSLGRIIREAGPLAGTTLTGVLFDSFEGGFQNWTDNLPAEFSKRKGYDLLPYLPVFTGRIVGSAAASEAVLWDFRQVLDDMFADNYFGTMHRLAAEHGMEIYSESQGGPLNPMSANRHVDVPMNEFWMPDAASRASRMKMSVSAAKFLGRPIIAAESFTAKPEDGRFLATPASLKRPGDFAFTVGINRFIFHHYTHQPVTVAAPGFALGRYGTHFGRLNTWWPFAGAWINYLTRCQALLQQGRTAADTCILVDEDAGYGLVSKTHDLFPGYDYDACAPEDLRAMTVRDGRLVHPSGQSYALLVLPSRWVAQLATLRHLRELIAAGATVSGRAPSAPAGLADIKAQGEFDDLCKAIWGKKPGLETGSPTEILARTGVAPDVAWTPADASFKYIHRTDGDTDLYFVFNYSDQPCQAELSFRQKGRLPEIWDPAAGAMAPAPVFNVSNASVSARVQFEPWGSTFVVFRKGLPARWTTAAEHADLEGRDGSLLAAGPLELQRSDGSHVSVKVDALPPAITVPGPWTVVFRDGRGAPPQAAFERLVSWSERTEPGIKYYSGIGTYTTRFDGPMPKEGQAAMLDLGVVADVAQVSVNGQDAGILWKPPYRIDIARLLRKGTNTLEVAVADRWINRLIGDAGTPTPYAYQKQGVSKFTDGRLLSLPDWLYDPAKRVGRTTQSFAVWRSYEPNDPLVPAGLLGPVKIEWFQRIDPSQAK